MWRASMICEKQLCSVAVLAQKCTNQQVSLTSLIARKKHVQIVQKVSFFTSGKQTYSHDQSWWEARKYVKAREIMALKLRLSASEAELFEEFFIPLGKCRVPNFLDQLSANFPNLF